MFNTASTGNLSECVLKLRQKISIATVAFSKHKRTKKGENNIISFYIYSYKYAHNNCLIW